MAHKIWSDEQEQWEEANDERIIELQTNMVKSGATVPLPPIKSTGDIPLPKGVNEGDTLWMMFNEKLDLDRAR